MEVLDNANIGIFAEIFIGEKLNPIMYEHSEIPLTLTSSEDLLDLDLNVQSIRRSLVKTQVHMKNVKKHGDSLEVKIGTLMSLNDAANIIQIVVLVIFGGIWLYLVKGLKRKESQK